MTQAHFKVVDEQGSPVKKCRALLQVGLEQNIH